MAYAYALDYNWALEGHATFGMGRSISDMNPAQVSIPIGNSSDPSCSSSSDSY